MAIKYCVKHGKTEFGKYGCKKCNYEKLDNARRKYKRLLVEYKGGKCEKCGKVYRDEVFDFHHKNPNEKEFGISTFKVLNIDKLKNEADKCILVCANCHREIHAQIVDEERNKRINEEKEKIELYFKEKNDNFKVRDSYKYLPYDKIIKDMELNLTKKEISEKYHVNHSTLNKFLKEHNISYRDNIKRVIPTREELIELLKKENLCCIGRLFNVSDNAVRKWCKKYNIDYKAIKRGVYPHADNVLKG